MKNNKIHPVDIYIKDKIKENTLDVNYNKGINYGLEKIQFNFSCKPVKEPYGDVSFVTGYDKDDRYTSTFLMSSEEALKLGKMLIDSAYEAMNIKRIILQAEEYETKLSFFVMKNAIDAIRIKRLNDKLENYDRPYYLYTISAYKGNEKVFAYNSVMNLSNFKTDIEINKWKDSLTNFGNVKLYLDDWDPYTELEEKKTKYQNEVMKNLDNNKLNLKPYPIIKK